MLRRPPRSTLCQTLFPYTTLFRSYHPILPLIQDLGIARVARPDLKMPRAMFTHADDAAEQLRLALEAHRRHFGRRPRGVWPPEAAVSDDVVRLAADHRVEWMLSDEGVLSRSLK